MRDYLGQLKSFFTREVIIFCAAVLAVAVLAVLYLVIGSLVRKPPEKKEEFSPPVIGKPENGVGSISMYELMIPDEIDRYLTPSLRFYREPRDSWPKEEVDTYWVDPRTLGIDILNRENRRTLEELFEKVP